MNAIIEITGQIATEDGFGIAKQILVANKNVDIQNIVLVINSGGGSTYAIPPIRESIEMCDKKVTTIGVGLVASTAMAIFMMGDVRILVPDTDAIIHKTTTGIRDNNPTEDEAEYALECAQRGTKRAWKSVIENSSLSYMSLSKRCKNKDWVLTEEEILKYGIITEHYDREVVKSLLMN